MKKRFVRSIIRLLPPSKLLTLYWLLPCELRKLIYKTLMYQDYHEHQRMRTMVINDISLKPFDDNNCIFVHIPKTAGISVSKSLFGNAGGNHMTIDQYQLVFSRNEFKTYFKFAFVRNPWDRLVSAYHFMKEGGFGADDQKWAEKNLAEYHDFGDFVKGWLNRKNIQSPSSVVHFLPQFKFVCTKDNVPAVDFIGYFENLEEDMAYIRDRLGISGRELLFLNKTRSRRQDYRSYYTEETKNIVADVYREDVRIFGYDFENNYTAFHSKI